jgi:hypothetical protein
VPVNAKAAKARRFKDWGKDTLVAVISSMTPPQYSKVIIRIVGNKVTYPMTFLQALRNRLGEFNPTKKCGLDGERTVCSGSIGEAMTVDGEEGI